MTARIPGMFRSRAVLCVLVAGATLATAESASAASSYCARLQSEYLSAVRAGGQTVTVTRKGDTSRIRRQLAAAESEAKSKNCRGLGLFRKPHRTCPAVLSKVNRLRQQLNQAGGRTVTVRRNTSDRDRIYSQLRRNGCRVPSLGDTASSGYQTLCVRTCDGYYFPISFRSSRSRFKTDEIVCKAMYGGADAELFYHSNGRSAEEAVSYRGNQRLESEPYAFSYRKTFNEACQAELKRGLANLGAAFVDRVAAAKKTTPTAQGTPAPILLPRPVARINLSVDPETRANLAGGFTVGPVTPGDSEEVLVAASTIRRLGPDYYYMAPPKIEALYKPPDLGPEFSLISSAHASEPPPEVDGPAGRTTVQ